jgi:hypothetical protein
MGRGNNRPFWYEYIEMYGQESLASVKQCVRIWEMGNRLTYLCRGGVVGHHHELVQIFFLLPQFLVRRADLPVKPDPLITQALDDRVVRLANRAGFVELYQSFVQTVFQRTNQSRRVVVQRRRVHRVLLQVPNRIKPSFQFLGFPHRALFQVVVPLFQIFRELP